MSQLVLIRERQRPSLKSRDALKSLVRKEQLGWLRVPYSLARCRYLLRSNLDAANAPRVVLFGHLGLGDQLSLIPSIEEWASRADLVLLPVKMRNISTMRHAVSYLPNVETIGISDEIPAHLEPSAARSIARRHQAKIVDAGRYVFYWAQRAFPEFGINRCLSLSALSYPTSMTSHRFATHLANVDAWQPPSGVFAFVDHHPGTPRQVPRQLMDELASRVDTVVLNPRDVPLLRLHLAMSEASELHLVSSAPLCMALLGDLGRGRRVRYRNGSIAPLKHDYPEDWTEIILADDGWRIANRATEAVQGNLGPSFILDHLARSAFVGAMSQMGVALTS